MFKSNDDQETRSETIFMIFLFLSSHDIDRESGGERTQSNTIDRIKSMLLFCFAARHVLLFCLLPKFGRFNASTKKVKMICV